MFMNHQSVISLSAQTTPPVRYSPAFTKEAKNNYDISFTALLSENGELKTNYYDLQSYRDHFTNIVPADKFQINNMKQVLHEHNFVVKPDATLQKTIDFDKAKKAWDEYLNKNHLDIFAVLPNSALYDCRECLRQFHIDNEDDNYIICINKELNAYSLSVVKANQKPATEINFKSYESASLALLLLGNEWQQRTIHRYISNNI